MYSDDKLILTLYINCTEFREVETDTVKIVQILFDGNVEGRYFNGKIMPGGVDTQTIQADGSGKLSARYCLEGNDYTGADCKMYISNEAKLGEEITEPTVYTDSKALKWINTAKLVGRLTNDENGLVIRIYER